MLLALCTHVVVPKDEAISAVPYFLVPDWGLKQV